MSIHYHGSSPYARLTKHEIIILINAIRPDTATCYQLEARNIMWLNECGGRDGRTPVWEWDNTSLEKLPGATLIDLLHEISPEHKHKHGAQRKHR